MAEPPPRDGRHGQPLDGEGRRISAGVDGVRWRPRSSKPLWGCVAVPGGFDPHALPPPAVAGLSRSWAGQVMRRGFAALQFWCATHRPGGGGRPLQELAWSRDVASGGGPQRSPRGQSTGFANDRAVGDAPAPGCARCRTGQDARALRVSAATSAYRRAGSDLPQTRPETRSPGWAASRTAAPTPARGANAPAPGCARCRTGQDAQAPRVSAATSASRRAGSDLPQTRPETRSPG